MKKASIIAISLLFIAGFFNSCKEKDEVPVLSDTVDATNITGTTATSGGIVVDEGTSSVISRGVCWSIDTKPTISDAYTTDGSGIGSFASNITGLNGATTYYVRAYATNKEGTGYGTVVTLTTLGESPNATILTATEITTSTATLNCIINPNYLATTVTFEYGTTTDYGIKSNYAQNPVSGNSNTNINTILSGLLPGTIYHCRIKAENSLGITYGGDIVFTTLGNKPSITNTSVTDLSTNGATLKCDVNANYLPTTITFEYGTTTDYGNASDYAQNPLSEGTGTDTNINTNISGLLPGTLYHYRIKAVNSLGTTYSQDFTFTTLGGKPSIISTSILFLASNEVNINGIINANYLPTLVTIEYGATADYGSVAEGSPNPVTGSSNSNFSASISGLTIENTYHYRIKAVNELGIAYGEDNTFTLISQLTDIDGNTYHQIVIGTQTWMAENLKVTQLNDGTDIQLATTPATWSTISTPGYCWYNNDETTFKATYGALYNWHAVNTAKLCPSGWHVPSDAEWTILTDFLGGLDVAGGKLKKDGTNFWINPNTGATNESLFSAMPGGYRTYRAEGSFCHAYDDGTWWSSTPASGTTAWSRAMLYNSAAVLTPVNEKNYGVSVRCIKD